MERELIYLGAMDLARVHRFHFTTLLITGMGFFSVSYNLVNITLLTKLLGRIYYTDIHSPHPGILPINVAFAISLVALCGTLVGQLFFGWLGDKMGRKKVYGITMLLMIVTSICSGIPVGRHSSKRVMVVLCFFRFWLGFGAGGAYPLTAIIMSEYANKKTRGSFVAAVYAMQGFGILMCGVVTLLVSAAFEYKYNPPAYVVDRVASLPLACDYIWRIVLVLGAFPAALAYYLRMKMPETPRYTGLVSRDMEQLAMDMSSVLMLSIEAEPNMQIRIVNHQYGVWSKEFVHFYGSRLLGIMISWYLLEVAMSCQLLVQSNLLTTLGWIPHAIEMSAIKEVYNIAKETSLFAFFGIIPGLWFSVVFIDIIGRLWIHRIGFFLMSVFMAIMASKWDDINMKENSTWFIVLYSFTFFFAFFGPRTTTFVLAAEIFPARLRSTCYGISSAAGWAGIILGFVGCRYLWSEEYGIGEKKTLWFLTVINFCGMLFSWFLPETTGKSLEEFLGEVERLI